MIPFTVRHISNEETGKTYYFAAVGTLEPAKFSEVVERIEKQCTLTRADVKGVLLSLEYVITQHLKAGHTVRLGNLGSFRPTIVSTEGSVSAEGVDSSQIKAVRCRFTPSATMVLSLDRSKVELKRE